MGERLGDYELGLTLGKGGMGTVFLATHTGLGVQRAVKLMARPDNPKGLARFEREVNSLAGISHPNVVRIHEAGVHRGEPWFAMDLVDGQPLEAVVSEERSWREAVLLAVGICRGVQALHERGVIHRDLKPANVMVSGDGRPVVIDLGLAVAPDRDQRLTKTGALLGTMNYMAPEQFAGARPSPASDVYALGLILYELLTGEPAVPVEGSMHAQARAILKPRTPPSRDDPDLPAALDALFLRATANDPAQRPENAGSLADALEAILANPGVSSRRRRALRVASAGLAFFLLCGGVGAAVALSARGEATPDADAPTADDRRAARRAQRALARSSAELNTLLRERSLPTKLAGLERWLDANPDHPQQAEATEALDRGRMQAPLLQLRHAGLCEARLSERYLLTAGSDGSVRLWDPTDGAARGAFRIPQQPFALSLSADGRTLVTRARRTVRVHTLPSGEVVTERNLPGMPTRIEISPDGTLIAVSDFASYRAFVLRREDLSTAHSVGPERAEILRLAWSADSRWLGTSCSKPDKRNLNAGSLWGDLQGQEPKRRAQGGENYRSSSVAVSPDGSFMAIGNSVGSIVLLSASSAVRLEAKNLELPELADATIMSLSNAHAGSLRGLAFSPDGSRLYSVAEQTKFKGELRVWDVASGAQVLDRPGDPVLPTHWDRPLHGVQLREDGRALLIWSGADHDVAELWALPEISAGN